jgi:site-specific DNA-methyltransferase (adenine-specific)
VRQEVIGDCTLYLGDALEVMATLEKVDAIVTDPPYFLPAAHYSVRSGSAKSLGDLSILNFFYAEFFKQCAATLKKTGFMYVFCDGQSYPVFYATAYSHFKKLRPLIWDKQVSINGFAWRHQHELIMFCEGESAPRIPTGDGDVIRYRSEPIGDREHLAQKPVDLMSVLVDKAAERGGVVLDPFMGSGTTGVAAVQRGRKFVGIEMEPKYFDIACKRLEAALDQRPLFDSEPVKTPEQLEIT